MHVTKEHIIAIPKRNDYKFNNHFETSQSKFHFGPQVNQNLLVEKERNSYNLSGLIPLPLPQKKLDKQNFSSTIKYYIKAFSQLNSDPLQSFPLAFSEILSHFDRVIKLEHEDRIHFSDKGYLSYKWKGNRSKVNLSDYTEMFVQNNIDKISYNHSNPKIFHQAKLWYRDALSSNEFKASIKDKFFKPIYKLFKQRDDYSEILNYIETTDFESLSQEQILNGCEVIKLILSDNPNGSKVITKGNPLLELYNLGLSEKASNIADIKSDLIHDFDFKYYPLTIAQSKNYIENNQIEHAFQKVEIAYKLNPFSLEVYKAYQKIFEFKKDNQNLYRSIERQMELAPHNEEVKFQYLKVLKLLPKEI